MTKFALWVKLEAKPGKESAVADFLKSAVPLVNAEPATTAWFAIKLGPSSFGIFDAFPDEAGRKRPPVGPSRGSADEARPRFAVVAPVDRKGGRAGRQAAGPSLASNKNRHR